MPFAVQQEIQCQIQVMEVIGAVQPSDSPWASPIILVRKKDGTLKILCGLLRFKFSDKER